MGISEISDKSGKLHSFAILWIHSCIRQVLTPFSMASLFGPTPTRPLVLHSSNTRISILVPASPLSAWVTSEVLAQDFHDSLVGVNDESLPVESEEGAAQAPASNEPQVKLLGRFLSFVADKQSSSPSSEVSEVLLASYDRFNELFLPTANIHSLVQSFEAETRAEVLKAYFKALTVARDALGASKVKVAHSSALIEAAKKSEAELYALFGGQGSNEVSLGWIIKGT